MAIVSEICEWLLNPNDCEDFALWAFGPGFKECKESELVEKWNERHSYELFLSKDGKPREDIPRMIIKWLDHSQADYANAIMLIIEKRRDIEDIIYKVYQKYGGR